jgi:hypothetical protein
MPMSTKRLCLQDLVPSAATRRVQPLQLQEVDPSVYCRVSYSMSGLESDPKVQTRVMFLFMLVVKVLSLGAEYGRIGACIESRRC